MSDVVTVHRASSSIEAEALRGWLTEEGIECRVDDPRDTAYPGILDRGQRWNLLVAASDEDAARDAISAWNEAEIAGGNGPYRGGAEPEESMSDRTPSQVARRKMAKRFAFGAVVVTSLCAKAFLADAKSRIARGTQSDSPVAKPGATVPDPIVPAMRVAPCSSRCTATASMAHSGSRLRTTHEATASRINMEGRLIKHQVSFDSSSEVCRVAQTATPSPQNRSSSK